MSGGLDDSRRAERAAIAIEQAAYDLVRALREVKDAAMPWTEESIALKIVNDELKRIGLQVVPR